MNQHTHTHTIKLCPLPAGTSWQTVSGTMTYAGMFRSKYNCWRLASCIFVCNILKEIQWEFNENCLWFSSSGWIPLNRKHLQHRQEDRNKPFSDWSVTLNISWLCKNSSNYTPWLIFKQCTMSKKKTKKTKHICFCLTENGFATCVIKRSCCVFTATRKWKRQVCWHHSTGGVHSNVCCVDVDLSFTERGDIQCLPAVTGGSDIWATGV